MHLNKKFRAHDGEWVGENAGRDPDDAPLNERLPGPFDEPDRAEEVRSVCKWVVAKWKAGR